MADKQWYKMIKDYYKEGKQVYENETLKDFWSNEVSKYQEDYSDVDYDGLDEILEEIDNDIDFYLNEVPDDIVDGDINKLSKYGDDVGDKVTKSFDNIFDSPLYNNLPVSDRLFFNRSRLGTTVAGAFDKVSSVSQMSIVNFLKNNGLLIQLPKTLILPAYQKLGSIFGYVGNLEMADGNLLNAIKTMKGGFGQVVDLGVRGSLLQASYEVEKRTGKKLKAARIVMADSVCDFCKARAGEFVLTGAEGVKSRGLEFHDNCRCVLQLNLF